MIGHRLVGLAVIGIIACGGSPPPPPPPATAPSPAAASSEPAAPAPPAADDPLAASVQFNLDRINALRAEAGVPPLVLDDAVGAFARASSDQLARDHVPHGHLRAVGMQGLGQRRRENQGAARGYEIDPADLTASVNARIEALLGNMMSEGPGGGHHDAIVGAAFTKLGVGLVIVDGRLYITNSFTD